MYNSKDHREALTRAAIGRKLKRDATAGLWGLLLVIPLTMLVIGAIYFELTVFFGKRVIFYVLAAVIAVFFLVKIGSIIYDSVRTILAVNAGEFSVTEDIFCQLEIRELPWRHKTRSHSFDYIFSFAGGKTYVTGSIDNTQTRLEYAVQFSKEGEKFYLITMDYNPDKILYIYPGVLFRYENR